MTKYPWNDKPCQLCGESHGDTEMYCGGPVGYCCPRCKKIVDKYMKMREWHLQRWEQVLLDRKLVNFGYFMTVGVEQ